MGLQDLAVPAQERCWRPDVGPEGWAQLLSLLPTTIPACQGRPTLRTPTVGFCNLEQIKGPGLEEAASAAEASLPPPLALRVAGSQIQGLGPPKKKDHNLRDGKSGKCLRT